MAESIYNKYVNMNLEDSIAGPIFREYKKLFGRYPPILLDLSIEKQQEIFKKEIKEEKEIRKKD